MDAPDLGTLLVVDDNRSVLMAVKLLAEMKFGKVVTSTSPSRIPGLLRDERPSCVLLDMNFDSKVNNGNEGLYWLSEIKRLAPETPVVLFTAYAEVSLAVEGLKSGATDFVTKPWDNARLLYTLVKAVDTAPVTARQSESGPLTLDEMEKRMIEEALADNGGILSAAATQLGISRQTLYNKMKKFSI
ncbi:MAG: DNA-binding response regulator [Duncaniella sp.]|nr:DNA-binding response regulator [Duncaniella sp.]